MQVALVKLWSCTSLVLVQLIILASSLTLASPAAPQQATLQPISTSRQAQHQTQWVSARPDSQVSAVLPSPLNVAPGQDEASLLAADWQIGDIERKLAPSSRQFQLEPRALQQQQHQQVSASDSKAVPVYVSPLMRPSANAGAAVAPRPQTRLGSAAEGKTPISFESPVSESKTHNYATHSDLKASASYGHHGHKHDHSKGWLDMGAWTGGKGSFGWYADYPVGSKKQHHYGRK